MTRDFILAACRDIIYRYGLQRLLIDEVASRCGTSKKTIYELFGSKELLIECLGSTFLKQEKEEFLAGIQQPGPLRNKLQFIIDHLLSLSEIIPIGELEYLKKKHKINHRMLLQYLEEVSAELERLLAAGQSAGEVYPDLEVSTQAKLLFAQLQYLHTNYRQLILMHPADHWRQHISTTFFRSTFIYL
ncbi:TetR/AcrR family transcriptional regulator [Cesiribacter sp. SM1]|uniref:TetR/AcrR family transcriptional regulator n=1 Tax=Cesiribacter sp. SM1 TaxID=2861196 RepID=UPI001CD3955F|nr:TetR/AcrR family transcriptional regulator [Cesiribacter sp. SM1]